MNIQDHIIKNIPVFEVGESIERLTQFFMDNTLTHVAVVESGMYIGVFNENDLEHFEVEKKIEDYRYQLESFFVNEDTSWLDVLETFARNESNVVPVVNTDKIVTGYYDITDIVSVFIDTPFFTEPGGILVVAKGAKDYSFSEIAQIVESNNSKILGAFVSELKSDVVQITVKISNTNLNEILQTFRRYNYNIIFGNIDDQFIEDLKQRSDYLDKYLNV